MPIPSSDLERLDVLPDSRCREVRGVVASPLGNLVPVYCASCGTEWGKVPEKGCTFAFVICNDCEAKNGPIAHLHREPDAVFWAKIAAEEMAARARHPELHPLEVVNVELQNPTSALSALARDWAAQEAKVA